MLGNHTLWKYSICWSIFPPTLLQIALPFHFFMLLKVIKSGKSQDHFWWIVTRWLGLFWGDFFFCSSTQSPNSSQFRSGSTKNHQHTGSDFLYSSSTLWKMAAKVQNIRRGRSLMWELLLREGKRKTRALGRFFFWLEWVEILTFDKV